MDVTEAALKDWVQALQRYSQAAIERACSTYLSDQPRRRPGPGDIERRAATAQKDADRKRGEGGLSAEQARAADWAVTTGRLSRAAATQAVQERTALPEWVTSEAEAAVYRIRQSPALMTPDDGGVTQYRRSVRD